MPPHSLPTRFRNKQRNALALMHHEAFENDHANKSLAKTNAIARMPSILAGNFQ